ncbi:methyltransferase domain-containing protein [Roseovarius salis]|uniref:class I SAM-dependent DNA methyltransferase n=1 Tax=Roseovarius salis TaxID=3376063 RepID=UPI0037C75F3B
MSEKFLDRVYGAGTPEATKAMYDAWAASYDAEIAENGYATPERVAAALHAHVADPATPVLDYGCGTGLSGLALRLAGFEVIDGMDPSEEMVEGARRKDIYRTLSVMDLDDPAPVPQDAYHAITATGVIGPGAGPATLFDTLLTALPPGGLLAFSLNDHALADPQYEAAMTAWLEAGAARLNFKEYGDHLPGQNIKCNVYIIEKA